MRTCLSRLMGVCAVLMPLATGAAELAFEFEGSDEPAAWDPADWTIVTAPDALPRRHFHQPPGQGLAIAGLDGPILLEERSDSLGEGTGLHTEIFSDCIRQQVGKGL